MRVIEPNYRIETPIDPEIIMGTIEHFGRVCYKSENVITKDSSRKFVIDLVKRGHESVLEHCSISVRIICDRGVTHEIVRHRIASYSQESTRYCNYTGEKFDNQITVIKPCFFKPSSFAYQTWYNSCLSAETAYFDLIGWGAQPQEARSVLPNSLKTEIIVTMNLREWRHFFRLRTAPAAHPQMRQITIPMYEEFTRLLPLIFGDLLVDNIRKV